MPQGYIGEIIIFGGNFAPQNWMFCNGQLLQIAQYNALFNLIGTTYGGDGQNTFALPDMRSRVPIHQGTGLGLSSYAMGQNGGVESVTLTTDQIPAHSHDLNEVNVNGNSKTPVGATIPANVSGTNTNVYSAAATDSSMRAAIVGDGGGGGSHNNIQPYLTLNYIINLFGVFPTQN